MDSIGPTTTPCVASVTATCVSTSRCSAGRPESGKRIAVGETGRLSSVSGDDRRLAGRTLANR